MNDPNASAVAAEALGGQGVGKAQEASRPVRQNPAGRTGAAQGEAPDRVSLSELGARVRALAVDPVERAAKLERLSLEVAAGRYQVDPLELSRLLIEEALAPRAEAAEP